MKKIGLNILFLLTTFDVFSQNIYNGDFLINNGNDHPILTGCGGTFAPGSVPNWYVTHGTPHVEDCNSVLTPGNDILMFYQKSLLRGEGIAGGYDFKPGVTYKIELKFCSNKTNLNPSTDIIWVKATTPLPNNVPTQSGQCGTAIPNLAVGTDFEQIKKIISLPMGVNNVRTLTFFHTMSSTKRNYIWIYPETSSSDFILQIVLNSVSITPACEDELIIDENTEETEPIPERVTNPHIKDGVYTGYRHIYAGAPYSSPNIWVRVPWWNVHTVFAARESITLSPVFEAARAGADGSFLAYIDPNLCFVDEGSGGEPDGEAKPGKPQNNRKNEGFYSIDFDKWVYFDNTENRTQHDATMSKSTVSIYPNPTTGAFHIEIPQRGNYTIRVMNMLGSTVYEGKMTDEQKKSILLDSSLPSGNYTVHISGDGLRHVERITLTK